MAKKKEITIRSSAAEYLTFITATGESGIEAIYADENVWLTQKMMGILYNVETNTINYHLKKIFSDMELDENSVIRKFPITEFLLAKRKRYVSTLNLTLMTVIIYTGNKVKSNRGEEKKKASTEYFSFDQHTISVKISCI